MKYIKLITFTFFTIFCLCKNINISFAQATNGIGNTPKKDTSKTNTNNWKSEDARITFEKLGSERQYVPDTALHGIQHLPFTEVWYRDLGNLGSPVNNLFFTPEDRVGPSLGYHIFDPYRYNIDSLNFYNTNRPYSVFGYRLGSKLEQVATIMHTQNVKPNLNFAAEYRKTNSPGYYKIQRNNNDNLFLTSNYKSLNKHYTLYAGLVYNQQQHDENGGIVLASQLTNPTYSDRRTVDVANQNDAYSITRSSVFNIQRDFTVFLQHQYVWGRMDTTYNSDSTKYTYALTPRFSLLHKLVISSEKHTYKDLTPDSLRYVTQFNTPFINNGNSPVYTQGQDSVYCVQDWFWMDNKFMLNGFLGKQGNQAQFSAGIGTRYDEFTSSPVSNRVKDSLPKLVYVIGDDRVVIIHNYLEGSIKKEALLAGQWSYTANAKLFFTGKDAGNFQLYAALGKELKNNSGGLLVGFKQQLNTAPYCFTNYENIYVKNISSFSDESVTTLFLKLESGRLRFSGGFNNYLINNYYYINENEQQDRYNVPINITNLWVRKVFKIGNLYLDNEFTYQQTPQNAPLNVPTFMGRHQLTYERPMFKRAMRIVSGCEIRYNSAYKPAGYDAILNRFFYQNFASVNNNPEVSVFLNFRIKRFRAFIMAEQLLQIFPNLGNTILFVGTPVINFNNSGTINTPVYAAPNANLKFGFSWVLIN